MDQWKELTHNRNRLVVKLLWGFYISSMIVLILRLGMDVLYPPIGLFLCLLATVMVYRKKNPIFTMYFIMGIVFIFFFTVIERYPNLVNVMFIWLALILSSLYQQYRVILLSGSCSIGLTIYAFIFYGSRLVSNFSHTDVIYLILFGTFATIYLIFYTKFTRDLWVKERENEQHLKNILNSVNIVIWSFDILTQRMTFSDSIYKITHYSKKEFEEDQKLWERIIDSKDLTIIRQNLRKIYEGQSKTLELRILTKHNKERWIQVRIIPNLDHNDKTIQINGVIIDITERKCMEEEIKYMAYHDVLTELPNRIQFNKHCMKVLNQAKNKNQKMAVLFIDLDQFKKVNDTLGHDIGDLLLKESAARLKSSLRETDFVCRIGGDEFVILLSDITEEQVDLLAQRIVDAFSNAFTLHGNRLFVTPSIGISIYPNNGENIETLIKNADDAMYLAKRKGKNNFQFFNAIKEHA